MMDYGFTAEQRMIKDLARQIAEEKVGPRAEHFDQTEEFPWEIVQAIAASDLFGIFIPDAYGGTYGGALSTVLVMEELSRQCAGVGVTYGAGALGSYPIVLDGNEEQRQKYLPRVAKGEILCAFALSESEAGSDASSLRASATPKAEGFVLNGVKQWTTNGGEAQLYSVFMRTDKSNNPHHGISAFLVEKGAPGFSFGKKYSKMGIRASATCDLVFEDCFVPKENLIGKLHEGFGVAMRTLDRARPGIAAQAIGIAQGSMETALKYSTERKQFDVPICEFQGLQFMLAKMASNIEAARALTYSVCRMIDNTGKDFSPYASMAKMFSSDMAMQAAIDAVQILGGCGYVKEYPAEKRFRDAKITQIYEGTNEIQKLVIARHLLKQYCRYDLKPLHN